MKAKTLILIIMVISVFPKGIETQGKSEIWWAFNNNNGSITFLSNETLSQKREYMYANGTRVLADFSTTNISFVFNGVNGTQNFTWFYDSSGFMMGYTFNWSMGNDVANQSVHMDFRKTNGSTQLIIRGKGRHTSLQNETFNNTYETVMHMTNIVTWNGTLLFGNQTAPFANITRWAINEYQNRTVIETLGNGFVNRTTIFNNGTMINETNPFEVNIYYYLDWAWSPTLRMITYFRYSIDWKNSLGLMAKTGFYSKKLVDTNFEPQRETTETETTHTSETNSSSLVPSGTGSTITGTSTIGTSTGTGIGTNPTTSNPQTTSQKSTLAIIGLVALIPLLKKRKRC